jgi:hypothetical protein
MSNLWSQEEIAKNVPFFLGLSRVFIKIFARIEELNAIKRRICKFFLCSIALMFSQNHLTKLPVQIRLLMLCISHADKGNFY